MGSVGAFAPLGASVFGCDVSYAQLCAFPAVAGSFQTRCWRKKDSNLYGAFARVPHAHKFGAIFSRPPSNLSGNTPRPLQPCRSSLMR
jgi:hypothetical protein